ncbi:Fanconi anemia group C protein isoform X2 [Boleophthalmus pectinirostris]|uniref:Fanconi anemia group C protein isoform X2 n=1 Tax=Boleophthalmus pectinirostris TaxID=150288 RepID=UPI00242AA068|nr:Fanconi anemia group C protein isoform X2 [Boleophthalmus pectinirostris]
MSDPVSQQTPDPSQREVEVQELQRWLETVKTWDQTDSAQTRKDICLHLRPLRDFLHKLQTYINSMTSTTEALRRLPLLGQFLGRLCWIPHVTADATSRSLLFQCLWGMYSEEPENAVEAKANQWIRKTLCQLTTDEEDTAQTLMKLLGVPPAEYHLKVLRKMLARLQEQAGTVCTVSCDGNQSCLCDTVQATSEACIPLVTCPEAASLIGALLQRPFTSVKAPLSEDFIQATGSAYSCRLLSLEAPAVVSLWWHSVSSLEDAVLRLMEQVLTDNKTTSHKLQQLISESLLPKACAQHCSIFLVVNDIFSCALKQMEENESLRLLITTFTTHFLKELATQKQQSVPLKAYFPKAPAGVLLPLLTQPSEMPEEAWRDHLTWLSGSLRRLSEEEEEEEDRDGTNRGLPLLFEAWFLLVSSSHWVDVALQLLVSSQDSDCEHLLWLLTFYHHPTNRGHHRDQQLVVVKEAWGHICGLFTAMGAPPLGGGSSLLADLLSPEPQQPSPAPVLILQLLLSSAMFSPLPLSGSTQILLAVVERSGVTLEAACVLGSLEIRLSGGGRTHTLLPRIKALQQALAPNT